MKKKKVVSFIPIKLINQRLPGKNTMILNGKPLCKYIFNTISAVEGIDERYVYCSDVKIKENMPDKLIFLQRNKELDGNEVKGLEIIDKFVTDVEADIYILIHATQPFTKQSTVQKALNNVLSGEYDSAFSAKLIQDYLWFRGSPINYDIKNIVRTQDLEPVYMETGAFFIFTKEVFLKYRQRIGKNPYICEVDQFEAHEIDTFEDFQFAELISKFINY